MKRFYLLTSMAAALFLSACNDEGALEQEKEVESTVSQNQSTSEEKSLGESDIETIVAHGSYLKYDEEPALYEAAELVVVAHTVKNFKDRNHVVKYVEQTEEDKGLPVAIEDFYTETPINIMKVLKQPSDSTIAKNESINIIEPISLLEDENGVKKLSTENYVELQKGKPYILYLKKNTYGQYSVINMNNGKFSLEGTDEVVNLAEHGHDFDKTEHQEMKAVVEKKFGKEIKEVKNNQ